ncbi:MAG: transposase, partial [Anaerolineaceae bacterium]
MLEVIRPRYLKATRKEKTQILDEFIAATGYHRKYAIRVLKHPPKSKGLKKPGKQRVYGDDVVQALTTIWEICGRICSKRLKPFIPEMLVVLERQRELILAEPIKTQLLTMSRATIDRC